MDSKTKLAKILLHQANEAGEQAIATARASAFSTRQMVSITNRRFPEGVSATLRFPIATTTCWKAQLVDSDEWVFALESEIVAL